MKKASYMFVPAAAAIFMSVILFSCAPYLSEDGESCPCKDGWKCCAGKCIPEDYICTPFEENNNSSDGGTGDGGDRLPYVPCRCRNSQDAVDDPDGIVPVCVHATETCNALTPCESDYFCNQHNKCECTDPDVCGIDCSSSCTCPGVQVCDHYTNLCRQPWICLDDSMCPEGQACRDPMSGLDHYICMEQGSKTTGQECGEDYECHSGVCYTQVCLQACRRNAECPSGQFCTEAHRGLLGCMLQTTCQPACSDPDQFCDFIECQSDYCVTSADCPNNCGVDFHRPVERTCFEHPDVVQCNDNEVMSELGHLNGYCIIYQACWTDADCPDPYKCYTVEELGGFGIDNPSLCARYAGP